MKIYLKTKKYFVLLKMPPIPVILGEASFNLHHEEPSCLTFKGKKTEKNKEWRKAGCKPESKVGIVLIDLGK